MALYSKNDLLRTLRALEKFDSSASPYVAVDITADPPAFYRNSNTGFIQSTNLSNQKLTHVSLSHFKDCLNVLKDENIELLLGNNGTLYIRSTDHTYDSELFVHTIKAEQAGVKYHKVGIPLQSFKTEELFPNFDTKSFVCAAAPILEKGRVLIPTTTGIILWTGPDSLQKIKLQPRESFLKCLSSGIEEICVTSEGYWGATSSQLMSFYSTHSSSNALFTVYSTKGNNLVNFPTPRLLYALSAASGLCADTGKIDICPTQGIVTRDSTGNTAKFAIGVQAGWQKFSLAAKSAKLIVSALSQSQEDTVELSSVPLANTTMRFSSGAWEVNTRTF